MKRLITVLLASLFSLGSAYAVERSCNYKQTYSYKYNPSVGTKNSSGVNTGSMRASAGTVFLARSAASKKIINKFEKDWKDSQLFLLSGSYVTVEVTGDAGCKAKKTWRKK